MDEIWSHFFADWGAQGALLHRLDPWQDTHALCGHAWVYDGHTEVPWEGTQ
jgi:hypothetical protein